MQSYKMTLPRDNIFNNERQNLQFYLRGSLNPIDYKIK